MGYVEEMRALIGQRPLILVGAAALIVNAHGQLLMVRRTDNGCWGVPGGMMEPGEGLEDTLRRETREEVGLELGEALLIEVFSGPDVDYVYPNGDQACNVIAAFLIREASGEIWLDPREHSQSGYFDLQHLPAPISPPIVPVLRMLGSLLDRQN